MGGTNFGTQTSNIQYGSTVTSTITENLILGVIATGIYSGGTVTATGPNSVQITPLVCSIVDTTSTYQQRMQTATTVTLTGLANTNPTYIVMRWTYVASSTNNYVDFLAITSAPNPTDIVLATLTGIGSSIVVSYTGTYPRLDASTFQKDLLVEQMETPGMNVHIRSGRLNSGLATYDIIDQISPLFVAPVSFPRVDVIGLNNTGAIQVVTGTENAGTPSYNGLTALAEITLQTSSTSITNSMIRNVSKAIKTRSLGAWVSVNANQIYGPMATDGTVQGSIDAVNGLYAMAILTDSNLTPVAVRANCEANITNPIIAGQTGFVSSKVRKGDYYQIVVYYGSSKDLCYIAEI